ncbi:hypothetical protein D0T92_06065 [Neisseria zalophi]|uniref:Integrase catalytic domain-containing protein n=1 Tax=Neisseria zalophi TaxID=640030 RepID=A0A5J6PUV3_9NEIS|nr:hypothetical protein D0T92_06065 [Neisseria zalophi]
MNCTSKVGHPSNPLRCSFLMSSISRKGNCWDNAPMESFFAILKTECFYQEGKLLTTELMQTIDDYI